MPRVDKSYYMDVDVRGNTGWVSAVPAIVPAAYAAGDLIGGKLELAGAVLNTAGSGIIHTITITDRALQNVPIDVVFFTTNPTTTVFTDNAALNVNGTDVLTCFVVSVLAADYASFVANSVATVRSVGAVFKLEAGTTLYAALVSRGAPTYVEVSDLRLNVGILQD